MNSFKNILLKLTSFLPFFFVPLFVYAACDPGMICNPVPSITSVEIFIKTLLTGVVKMGIPIVALAIIYSGFLFVAARGNSEKITQAKESLMYTLIGSAILLGSWAIALLIESTVESLK